MGVFKLSHHEREGKGRTSGFVGSPAGEAVFWVGLCATGALAVFSGVPAFAAVVLFWAVIGSSIGAGGTRAIALRFAAAALTYAGLSVALGDHGLSGEVIAAATLLPGMAGAIGISIQRLNRSGGSGTDHLPAVIDALALALEARDGYTSNHSYESCELVLAVADEIGLGPNTCKHLSEVALLHDIGKIGIPNEILHAPGELSDDQWRMMRRHPLIGQRIVACVPGMENVALAIRHEHERWDGAGYPDGLAREDIPLASRIVFVCDAFHAMTSDRPYRGAMPVSLAIDELERHAGSQFDPDVVDALVSVLRRQQEQLEREDAVEVERSLRNLSVAASA